MSNILRMALVILTSFILAQPAAHAAGFDCSNASAPVEKAICGYGTLSRADDQLNDAYTFLITYCPDTAAQANLRATQRLWLAATRSAYRGLSPEALDQLAAAYRERNAALGKLLARCNSEQGPVRVAARRVQGHGGGSLLFLETNPPQTGWRINRMMFRAHGYRAAPPPEFGKIAAFLATHTPENDSDGFDSYSLVTRTSNLLVLDDNGSDCEPDALRCSPYDRQLLFDIRTGRLVPADELYSDEGADKLEQAVRKKLIRIARAKYAAIPKADAELFGDQYKQCMDNWASVMFRAGVWPNYTADGHMEFYLDRCSPPDPYGAGGGDDEDTGGKALDGISLTVAPPELRPYLSVYGRSLLLGEGDVRAPVAEAPLACKKQRGLPVQRNDRDPAPGIQVGGGQDQYQLLTPAGKLWLWTRFQGSDVPYVAEQDVVQAGGGDEYNAFIKRNGTLWAASTTFRINLGTDFVSVQANPGRLMALKKDGTAWGWKLGDGSVTRLMADVQQVGFGAKGERLLLKRDGSLWALGGAKLFGGGATYDDKKPRLLGKGFTRLGVQDSDLAYKADGSLWAWEAQLYHVFSMNPAVERDYTSPVNIGGGFVNAKVGGYESEYLVALKADGSLWMAHQHGDVTRPRPVGCGYVDMVYGNDYLLTLKADGSLELWGDWDMQQALSHKPALKQADSRSLGQFASHKLLGKGFTRLYQVNSQWYNTGVRAIALRNDGSVWRFDPSFPLEIDKLKFWFGQAAFPKDAHIGN